MISPFLLELISLSSPFSFPIFCCLDSNVFLPVLPLRPCPGGRGVVVGPIVSQTLPDVFCDNEYGPNFLFRNNGDGTFTDVAQQAGEPPS